MDKYSYETQFGKIHEVLSSGGVIILIGRKSAYLMCSAFDEEAVTKAFRMLRKEPQNPLVLYMSNIRMVERYADTGRFSYQAHKYAESVWPCDTILVLRTTKRVPQFITCGLNATGFCCPTDKFVRQISCLLNCPVVLIKTTFEAVDAMNEENCALVDYSLYLRNSVIFDCRDGLTRI